MGKGVQLILDKDFTGVIVTVVLCLLEWHIRWDCCEKGNETIVKLCNKFSIFSRSILQSSLAGAGHRVPGVMPPQTTH